mgnify:CR=1 FL=1
MRALRRRWRDALYALFGNKCVRCEFSDSRALQIDHIAGGGSMDRTNGSYYRMLVLSEKARSKVQLLCANCNWIKKVENNE